MTKTDYLIVGAGAVGMIFADQMLAEGEADMIIVDRRAAPGGHWVDAYPFVRLHLPSAYYGAASRELGSGRIDEHGFNAGLYEMASLPEVQAHFDGLMRDRFLPSGRVRFFPMSEHLGEGRIRSLETGEITQVGYRKIADTTHSDVRIPATHTRRFVADEGIAVIPPNDLPRRFADFQRYCILGASKTAMDTASWLLQKGVAADAIRWIRPRESWVLNRAHIQPGARFQLKFNTALADMLEAAAAAADIDDLFDRLEAAGTLIRIDRTVKPTMFRGATLSEGEAQLLRQIKDVVRLGHALNIQHDRISLTHGAVETLPDTLYIDCTAKAFTQHPSVPVFQGDRIVPQTLRGGVVCLSAAVIAHVEAAYPDDAAKNHLCPPIGLGETRASWIDWTLADLEIGARWATDQELRKWIGACRLTGFRAGEERPAPTDEARAVAARIGAARPRAAENLRRLAETAEV